jgi:hypothetical protein
MLLEQHATKVVRAGSESALRGMQRAPDFISAFRQYVESRIRNLTARFLGEPVRAQINGGIDEKIDRSRRARRPVHFARLRGEDS